MKLSIEEANINDLDQSLEIYESCNNWLSVNGLNHWEGIYTHDRVTNYINKKILFILKDDGVGVGVINVTKNAGEYYTQDITKYWKDKTAEAIYISALAVLPEHMSKGYAVQMLEFTEEKAKEENIKYIRLDTIANYEKLTQFYEKTGFKVVGNLEIEGFKLNLYEKELLF